MKKLNWKPLPLGWNVRTSLLKVASMMMMKWRIMMVMWWWDMMVVDHDAANHDAVNHNIDYLITASNHQLSSSH